MPSGRLPTPPRFGGFCECGDHAWAKMSQGLVTLVSPEDAPLILSTVWTALVQRRLAYATAWTGSRNVRLHRLIAGATADQVVDHANRNGLDNRRQNIRACSQAENTRNMYAPLARKTSRFKGVSFDARSQKWRACVRVNTKQTHIALFENEVDAALAYDRAAVAYHGSFARTNKMMGLVP